MLKTPYLDIVYFCSYKPQTLTIQNPYMEFSSVSFDDSLIALLVNPRRACAARVTVLSLCACVSECVCYLSNSYAVNVQVQSKMRIESKCGTEGF